ncbi:MAG: hypothetical protein JWM58_4523 [Rhizobium sp.]|nr:hypothetical protein [Rhizobium sp.]
MDTPSKHLTSRLLVAVSLFSVASSPWAAKIDNCNAPADPTLKGAEMSQKLRRCNSVLKPSKSADPDIIIPAPIIDDPLTIHPKDVPPDESLTR